MGQQAGGEDGSARAAMRLSLYVGILMLAGKTTAWIATGSAAILSDAMESVIHLAAVAFAAFSLRVSLRPADPRFRYGYERIGFFSAGFEGALIILAAVSIIAAALYKWMHGLEIQNLGWGTVAIAMASLINAWLGWRLIRAGKRSHSVVLEANGRHVLTDSWTSFGVVGGLVLVLLTGWRPFDPLVAMAVALNIVWTGWTLVRSSIGGLMDYADPATARALEEALGRICGEFGIQYHELRFRSTGSRLLVEAHLLFPYHTPVGEAHSMATVVEGRLQAALDRPAEVITHLEALEDHARVHVKR